VHFGDEVTAVTAVFFMAARFSNTRTCQLLVGRRGCRLAVKDGSPSTAQNAPAGDAGDDAFVLVARGKQNLVSCQSSVVS
jgi:hypothetical protein